VDIKLLEDFVCLVKLQSFTDAARERSITQSAFSRRIKTLEEWLGTQIINRENNLFELTPQGKLFVQEAKSILEHLYSARKSVREADPFSNKKITIAAQHSIAQTLFINWAKQLEGSLNSGYIRLSSEKLKDCVQLFSKGEVDYMLCFSNNIVSLPVNEKKFYYITVGKEKLIPISAPSIKNPKEAAFTLPGSAKNPVPFIDYTHGSSFGQAVNQIIQDKKHCCFLSRRYENDFSHIIKSMVIENLGLAWLPKSLITSELESGRLHRAGDEQWDIEFDIRLYYHASESIHAKDVLKTSFEMAQEVKQLLSK
jgi:LysR family transcriptional regulator, hypochlorite-specific transcription factor HypT